MWRPVVAAVAVVAAVVAVPATGSGAAPQVVVSAVGNHLVDGAGRTIRLLGVDRSGAEYACIQGWGFFDGPTDATSVAAIASWHTNAVRLPLNEDCWLGINSSPSNVDHMGVPYRQAIKAYVRTLHAAGLAVILDLHVSGPGAEAATGALEPMADADHSPAFWASVARAFAADPGVLFDLFNEPHDISWSCWLRGCTAADALNPGQTFKTVGMQALVNKIRSTGATQVIMAGGLGYSGDLARWPNGLTDPLGRLAASVHVYNFANETQAFWDRTLAPVAAGYPLITGEIGEYDCAHAFIDGYLAWADAHGASYLAWTWDAVAPGGWQCSSPALIKDYTGTPTAFGVGYRDHLLALSPPTLSAPLTERRPPRR